MRKGLILVSLLGWMAAGCGGSSKSGNGGGGGSAGGTGGGSAGGGGTGASPDLATPAAPADMTQLACADIVACVEGAADNPTAMACVKAGSSAGQTAFNALVNCLNTNCGNALLDAGTGPCTSADQCQACVQSGTAPGDMGQNGPNCSNSLTANNPVTDPLCGLCVVADLNCFNP